MIESKSASFELNHQIKEQSKNLSQMSDKNLQPTSSTNLLSTSTKFNLNAMKRFKLFSFIRRRYRSCSTIIIVLSLVITFLLYYSGVFLYLMQCELDDCSYPHVVNQPNLTNYVAFYLQNFKDFSQLSQLKEEANKKFEYKTLENQFNERYIIENENKCMNETGQHDDIRILILVKSALPNRKQRDLIRKSWANEKRFSDVKIRSLFSVGSCDGVSKEVVAQLDKNNTNKNCQDLIDEENEFDKDLLQIDFLDTYYNNTIKTMNGIKWMVKNCPKIQFLVLIDDDYYLSIKNLLSHIRLLGYENGEKERVLNQMKYMKSDYEKSLINAMNVKFDTYTQDLYEGWVFNDSRPCRSRFSKWFVDLDEYPFSKWPPYVTAGFVLISNKSLKSIYFASLYTKSFRFDDIYLSILTRKTGIYPVHNTNVYFYKPPYSTNGLEYKNVIASHGFKNLTEMTELWLLMKSKGFA